MRKYGKILATALLIVAGVTSLCSCSGKNVSYQDGTYEGKSEPYETEGDDDSGNGYGVVNLTIKDGKIVDCTYKTYLLDGTLKDETYGMEGGQIANKDFYNKAQKANAACAEYASMLIANGKLDGIDAISGATINYNEFKEAVKDALSKAEKKS